MEKPPPSIEFHEFGTKPLGEILKQKRTHALKIPGQPDDPFRQLSYIEEYLKNGEIACRSVIIERHYIDRDYMEDHSVFYSRSLHPYENWCQRIHFFDIGTAEVKANLDRVIDVGRMEGKECYDRECRDFSREHYCGFSVIKPLSGSPVGRTVLIPYGNIKADGSRRAFPCVRPYKTHVLGVELIVYGLAFQQQDLGVSACATTAIWSSLQQFRAFEELGTAMPAQITKLASQHALPFGRSMPSEGLSVDQMCMAIEGLGMAPSLLRADEFLTARSYIYSATQSGSTPILILQIPTTPPLCHAVAVVGINTRAIRPKGSYVGDVQAGVDDAAANLVRIYLHDDRNGPYLRADIEKGPRGQLILKIDTARDMKNVEDWELTHILIPSHSKIRLSFSGLRSIALGLSQAVNAFRQIILGLKGTETARVRKAIPALTIVFDTYIQRCHSYNEGVILNEDAGMARRFMETLSLPRHVGVVRLSASYFGTLDILVDTTSTLSNLHFVGIIRRGKSEEFTEAVGNHLANECQAPLFV